MNSGKAVWLLLRILEENSKSSISPRTSPIVSSEYDNFTEITATEKEQLCVVTPAKSNGSYVCSVADCDFKTESSKSIRMHLKSHLTDESKAKRTGKIEILKRKQISIVGPDGGSIEPIITEEGFCECPLCRKTFQLRSVFKWIFDFRFPVG